MTKLVVTSILIFGIVAETLCGVIISGTGGIRTSDVNIYSEGDILNCGTLTCPRNSKCIITQKNDPENVGVLVTREKCFDDNDEIIKSTMVGVSVGPEQQNTNIRYEYGPHGIQVINPELSKEISENVQKTIQATLQNVQHSLSNTFSNFGPGFPFGDKNPFGPGFPFTNTPFDKDYNNPVVPKRSELNDY